MFSLIKQDLEQDFEIPHVPHKLNDIHLFEELIVASHEYFMFVSVLFSASFAAAVAHGVHY